MAMNRGLNKIVREAAESGSKKIAKDTGDKLNPALKKVRDKAAKNISQRKSREEGLNAVRKGMQESMESVKPINEFINENLTGLPSQRGSNARMSGAKTFNSVFNTDASVLQQESIIRDKRSFFESQKRDEIIKQNRSRSKQLESKLDNAKPENLERYVNSNGVNTNNATGNGNKAKRRIEQIQAEKNAEITKTKVDNNDSKIRDEINKQKDKKVEDSRKYFTNENIKKTVGLGVGGAIVFNMFDKGGQMSNAELYGQQQPYGY